MEMSMDGLFNIYKPSGMTSFDVIAQLRKHLNMKKIGHAGTLDPMAEGVLVVAVGNATKALNFIDVKDKRYIATCDLGHLTHSGDITGTVTETAAVIPFTQNTCDSIADQFVGQFSQRVPKVSAKKIDGKRSYAYVLEQKEVKTLYTDIEIYECSITKLSDTQLKIEAYVSNGTYMRTLCEDVAVALGTIGTMSSLLRTSVGSFVLNDAIKVTEANASTVVSVKDVMRYPVIKDVSLETLILHGKRIRFDSVEPYLVFDAGTYFSVYELESEHTYKPIRGLW